MYTAADGDSAVDGVDLACDDSECVIVFTLRSQSRSSTYFMVLYYAAMVCYRAASNFSSI